MLELTFGWLTSKGVSLVLGALVNAALGAWQSYQANQAQREVGQLKAERDQAREGERVQGELAEQAGKRVSEDDAISRLEKGEA